MPTGDEAGTATSPGFSTSTRGATSVPTAPQAAPTTGYGPGSAKELRAQIAAQEKAKQTLQAKIDARDAAIDPTDTDATRGPRPDEQKQLSNIDDNIVKLWTQVSDAEKQQPTTVSGTTSKDKHIIQTINGVVVVDPKTGKPPLNPNWDGVEGRPQQVTVGSKIINIAPDGTPTVAYTDEDAKNLAERQMKVTEANARLADAQQKVAEKLANSKIELDERVANGETASEVRAQQAQEMTQFHNEWVRADGDYKRLHQEWVDYQTERHNTASETLKQEEFENTKKWQAMQDATTQRAQDLTAKAAEGTTRASLANQRLSSGGTYMGNVLSTLSQLNKDVAPGSSAVGEMLVPLLGLGQQFFSQLGGLESADSIVGKGGGATPATAATLATAATPATSDQDAAAKLNATQAANQAALNQGQTNMNQLTAGLENPAVKTAADIPPIANRESMDQLLENMRKRREELNASGNVYNPNQGWIQSGMGGFGGTPMPQPLTSWSQSMPNFGYGGLQSFADGGVVQGPPGQPMPVIAHGGETVLPTGQPGQPPPMVPPTPAPPAAPPPPAPLPPPPPSPVAPDGVGPNAPIAQLLMALAQVLAAQGAQGDMASAAAANTGNPPAAGANPNLPGSAVPGVPPEAAAAQARAQPLAPDGSPYVKPEDVQRAFATRREQVLAR
jgi:hypothetical protein